METSTDLVHSVVTRRSVLGAMAAGALALGAASACTAKGTPKGKTLRKSGRQALLPAYVPNTALPPPDLPGGNGVDPAYLTYPAHLASSVHGTPGAGSTFTVMASLWGQAPNPNNGYWKYINQGLGATIKFEPVPVANYPDKVAAVIASKDVPDAMSLFGWSLPTNISEAAPALYADLTPYLSGDAIKEYPNLAYIPTDMWQNMIFGSGIYALPSTGLKFGNMIFYRKDIFDQFGLAPPTSADEWLALAKELTDEKAGRWATDDPYIPALQVFGAPDNWRKDSSGKLVSRYETPEFEAAVEFTRKMFAAGYVHPDGVVGNTTKAEQDFQAGKLVMQYNGRGAWAPYTALNKPSNPRFDMQPFKPFAAQPGQQPIWWADGPPGFYTFLSKKLSPDKIKEFLRLANYLAAPFGTTEYERVAYGRPGVDHTTGPNGAPVTTAEFTNSIIPINYNEIILGHYVLFSATHPDITRSEHDWQEAVSKVQVTDPTYGLHPTLPPRLATINQKADDSVNEITRGRASMGSLKSVVSRWRSSGGDELRELYQKALS